MQQHNVSGRRGLRQVVSGFFQSGWKAAKQSGLWKGDLHMFTRSNTQTSWRRGGKLTAVVAGMAAISVATLGFASAAGAAGVARTPQKGENPSVAGSSTTVAGYQTTPNGGLASASVTFTVPKITCTATDKADGATMWSGVYTSTL